MILKLLFSVVVLSSPVWAASSEQTCFETTTSCRKQQIIKQIQDHHLQNSPEWPKLLFYALNMFGQYHSLIDHKEYFLAQDGAKNPQDELYATVDALFLPPVQNSDSNQHPICRYPRRLNWLMEHTDLKRSDLPQIDCADYEYWRQGRHYDGASVVFSSSYPNNPSSLFGHTFIRMHRSQAEQHSKLLDDAINFSAFPDTDNPLLYTLKGLAGGFPGYFSFTPYYLKVQEYSNADSRDLWEYRLRFTSHDIENMIATLWEMGPHQINYYYFDENCSAIILHYLEAVKPELQLTQLSFWVIPSDTVKTIARIPGLTSEPVYRPSALSRFLAHYRAIDTRQKTVLEHLLWLSVVSAPQLHNSLARFSDKERAEIIDATLEYIDFYERLAGSGKPATYGSLRALLLTERSRLPVLGHVEATVPQSERPDLGHDSARLGAALGHMTIADQSDESNHREPYIDYQWRPALHDRLSSDVGYAAGLGIEFFHTKARQRLRSKKIDLYQFDLLRIMSLPRLEQIVKRPAWNFQLGSDLDYSCESAHYELRLQSPGACRRYFLKSGAGYSGELGTAMLLGYVMANLSLGHSDKLGGGSYLEPSLTAGTILELTQSQKLEVQLNQQATRSRQNQWAVQRSVNAEMSYAVAKNMELRLRGQWRPSTYQESSISFYRYL